MIRLGLSVPNFGVFADPRHVARLARVAEAAGWDGLFIWDHVAISNEFALGDPWIALAAAAAETSRIRLGTMVTPLPRRRPWKVARESVGLDLLSGGRFTLGVGVGSDVGGEFRRFGEVAGLGERAARLDEGLSLIADLWSGRMVDHEGPHYRVRRARFLPGPIQEPRIPVVVGGHWPHDPPLRRAARWDGYAPLVRLDDGSVRYLTAAELGEAAARLGELRGSLDGFALFAGGSLPHGEETGVAIAAAAAAGATWWLGLIEAPLATGAPLASILEMVASFPVAAMAGRRGGAPSTDAVERALAAMDPARARVLGRPLREGWAPVVGLNLYEVGVADWPRHQELVARLKAAPQSWVDRGARIHLLARWVDEERPDRYQVAWVNWFPAAGMFLGEAATEAERRDLEEWLAIVRDRRWAVGEDVTGVVDAGWRAPRPESADD